LAAGTGACALRGIRKSASFDHPRCHAKAICVHGLGRYGPPDGRRGRSNVPDYGVSSRDGRSSPADRTKEGKKKLCCVTTRRCNVRVKNGLRRELGLLPALLFLLGVLGLDTSVLATLGLPPCCLPAADLPQAFRSLTLGLVPRPRPVLASTSFAQAAPRARLAHSGRAAITSRDLETAHGRCFLPREKPRGMSHHSPRALSKREPDACSPVYPPRERDTALNGFTSTSLTRQQDQRPRGWPSPNAQRWQ
jgi:hypothetical protein